MHFLFDAGDILETRPLLFDEAKCGDVIVFQQDGKTIVHRILRKSADALRTIGDNNDRCDPWQLTRSDRIFLVERRIDRKGRSRVVRRGQWGMVRFFRNRTVRKILRISGFCGRLFFRMVDWRKPLPTPEKFGDEFCYMSRNRVIAWRKGAQGAVQFIRFRDRLKYRSK